MELEQHKPAKREGRTGNAAAEASLSLFAPQTMLEGTAAVGEL